MAFKVFFGFMKNSLRLSSPQLSNFFVLCEVNIEVKLENILWQYSYS